MLGFDTIHDNGISDAQIRRLADEERRVVLTRDRELLKCREILTGCYVRAIRIEAQLREVVARLGLLAHARPFTRCLCCNTTLAQVSKASIAATLPESVAREHEQFYRCPGCGRVYWPGSHYRRMQDALARVLD